MTDLRVLIVEDDPMVAGLHDRWVRAAGFVVAGTAATAEIALAAVDRGNVDLVVLDLGLPGADGLAFLAHLRRAGAAVDVLVVSARRDPEAVTTALRLGAVDYLVKPFEQDRFAAALAAFVARRAVLGRATLNQRDLDSLGARRGPSARATPKGIAPGTLDRVRAALTEHAPADADAVASAVGLSRVATRRYLEHLVGRGEAASEEQYGGPGRPRKAYRPAY